MINAIMACDDEFGVGLNNRMPWPRSTEDLQWFKKLTRNKTVVMGSKTWHSDDMPSPLPNRHNVVVTGKPENYPDAHECIPYENMTLMESIDKLAYKEEIFIIGGAVLIEQVITMIDQLYLSRFSGDYGCDRFIDPNSLQHFVLIKSVNGYDATYQTWVKNRR